MTHQRAQRSWRYASTLRSQLPPRSSPGGVQRTRVCRHRDHRRRNLEHRPIRRLTTVARTDAGHHGDRPRRCVYGRPPRRTRRPTSQLTARRRIGTFDSATPKQRSRRRAVRRAGLADQTADRDVPESRHPATAIETVDGEIGFVHRWPHGRAGRSACASSSAADTRTSMSFTGWHYVGDDGAGAVDGRRAHCRPTLERLPDASTSMRVAATPAAVGTIDGIRVTLDQPACRSVVRRCTATTSPTARPADVIGSTWKPAGRIEFLYGDC